MKRVIYINYWLMILGWCLFLNNYVFLATLSTLTASFILILRNRKINYWRFLAVFLISSTLSIALFNISSIPYYFPKMFILIGTNSLNMALMNEVLKKLSNKFVLPVYIFIILIIVTSIIIALFLPDDLYSLFTKTNLYRMIGLIFLPSALSYSICLLRREIIMAKARRQEKLELLGKRKVLNKQD